MLRTVCVCVLVATAVFCPRLDALDHVLNVKALNARGEGTSDDGPALQAALNMADRDGGGIVFVPAGKYLIKSHLVIPPDVTLEGVWQAPTRGLDLDRGTTLLAVEGKGNADGQAFITLNTNSVVKGITVFYPEQVIANPPHEYPWCIQGAAGSENFSVIDVTLVNPYQAVDFGTYASGRHYINRLHAHALYKGLYINQCYDVGRIENIHFWPFWDVNPASPLWAFTKEHGTAFIIGRTDGEMALNCFSIFYHVGMHFIAGPEDDHAAPGSGAYTNCYMDITPCAVKIDQVAEGSGVSFVNGMFMAGVEVGPENRGPVKFTGSGFWANRGQTYHARLDGRGTVLFESCHFMGWDQAFEGIPCIDANNNRLLVNGCSFESGRSGLCQVALGPRVKAAVVSSNLMGGGVNIRNGASESADIQTGLNAGAGPEGYVEEWLVLGAFPNPGAGGEEGPRARAGLDTDYLAPLGGEEAATLTETASVALSEGVEARARVARADEGHMVDFKALFPEGKGVAYAFCYLESDHEQHARIEYGANDCSKVWVNGKVAHTHWEARGGSSSPGAQHFDVELKKGLNPVLLKVEDAGGRRWEFVFEAYDADGNPLRHSIR